MTPFSDTEILIFKGLAALAFFAGGLMLGGRLSRWILEKFMGL